MTGVIDKQLAQLDQSHAILMDSLKHTLMCFEAIDAQDSAVKTEQTSAIVMVKNLKLFARRINLRQKEHVIETAILALKTAIIA